MSKIGSDPKVKKCTCKHEYQDKKYGSGYRLHNECVRKQGVQEYRCTVCGNVRGQTWLLQ